VAAWEFASHPVGVSPVQEFPGSCFGQTKEAIRLFPLDFEKSGIEGIRLFDQLLRSPNWLAFLKSALALLSSPMA
jgi:hypothetical protein